MLDSLSFAGALGLALAAGVADARADEPASWSLDAATEPSRVTLGARDVTWWTNRIQLNARTAPSTGWFVATESQKREQGTDAQLSAGVYGRVDQWTWSGQVSGASDPRFLPRYSFEPQIGRQFGNLVVQGGAVYKRFADSRVRIATLGVIAYRGESELEFKLHYGKSEPFDRHIRVATLRGTWDRGGRFVYGAAVSVGQSLYDSSNVPGVSGNHGWIAAINMRYRINDRDSVRIDLSEGREDPMFRERKIGLSFRKSF